MEFRKIQELIADYLEILCKNNSEFDKLYLQEKSRVENNGDVSLFVKNIENVKGDERYIIIFSIEYAKGENSKVASRFGTLS